MCFTKLVSSTAAVAPSLFLATAVHAADLIKNGSFEDGSFLPPDNATQTLPVGSHDITGWKVVGDSIAWIGAGNPWGVTAQDGVKYLDLSDYQTGAPFGGVSTSCRTPQVGAKYAVSFYLGSSNRWGRPSALTVSAGNQNKTVTSSLTGTDNDWTPDSLEFTAISPTTTISFVGAAGAQYIGLDNVTVSPTAVP